MTSYSHSRLGTFQQCRYKYKLQYIDKVKVDVPTTIEAFTGALVHKALEKLYKDLQFQKLNTKEELLTFFENEWEKTWDDLKEKLKVASGGIIFTTIQKFSNEEKKKIYDLLSTRKNIIVMADEAHRSQYGFKAKISKKDASISYGFAKYLRDALPNASFIGFTGTPIEFEDKNTRAIFGDYIDTYDIEQAVKDKRTVRIYYESRLVKLDIDPEEKKKIDEEFEEVTETEEEHRKEKLKGIFFLSFSIISSSSQSSRQPALLLLLLTIGLV